MLVHLWLRVLVVKIPVFVIAFIVGGYSEVQAAFQDTSKRSSVVSLCQVCASIVVDRGTPLGQSIFAFLRGFLPTAHKTGYGSDMQKVGE